MICKTTLKISTLVVGCNRFHSDVVTFLAIVRSTNKSDINNLGKFSKRHPFSKSCLKLFISSGVGNNINAVGNSFIRWRLDAVALVALAGITDLLFSA